MYTLYITNKRYSSWSMRPWVLLKALNIPFEEKLVKAKAARRQDHFAEFSPTAKVPCLHDTDEGIVVWESLAVCEYIAEQHPQVWPSDRAARAWARAAAAEMHAGFNAIRNECSMNVGVRVAFGPVKTDLQEDLDRFSALFKEGLTKFGGPWLAGKDFSVADAFFAPIASRTKTYGLQLDGEAQEYIDRLFEHPVVKGWIEDGIRESDREPYHEADITKDGRVVIEELSI